MVSAHFLYVWNYTCLAMTGVGAADITKLKANGYYTVAVRTAFQVLHTLTTNAH